MKLIAVICSILFVSNAYAGAQTFVSHIQPIPSFTRQAIEKYTWHPACPLGLNELSSVEISYWGFDQQVHQGVLIVNHHVAKEVVDIFREIFQQKFPIEKIVPIDYYHGDDKKAMLANDTSAFLCRKMTRKPHRFSTHSYGTAIDINPVQNPYVIGNYVEPTTAKAYLNRKLIKKGMITKGDVVYNAFKRHGWRWGGDWHHIKDYQHFEKN